MPSTRSATSHSGTSQVPPNLIYILAAIIALGPLSVDLYLPAMPSMRLYFATDISQVQLTLSSYLLGFSLFHLICGPLSDRFGRKPVLLAGLCLYAVMSVFCARAETIEQLIIYRFFQAMGACCAPTLGRAIVRDVYSPAESVKALAYVSSLMAIAPVIAPSIGGVIVKFYDWPMTFYLLTVAAFIAILLTLFAVDESLPEVQALHPLNIIKNYWQLLSHRLFMGHVLTASFLYSCAFSFLSGASFVLIDFLKVPAEYFGLYFLFIVAGYIAGNMYTAKVAFAWAATKLYFISIVISIAAALAMVMFAKMQWYYPLLYVAPVFFSTLSIGLVLPKSMAEALKPFAHMAATASALMGFIQMSIASLAGWLVGHYLTGEPTPMAWVIALGGILALLSFCLLLYKPLLLESEA
jgi:DHA1 family bicyclomycin/chloramphenicol resistance-like MFS transporter